MNNDSEELLEASVSEESDTVQLGDQVFGVSVQLDDPDVANDMTQNGSSEMVTLTKFGSKDAINGESVNEGFDDVDSEENKEAAYQKRRSIRDSMYFTHDEESKKRIDFVLVYEDEGAADERRQIFEQNLLIAGLEIETDDKSSSSDQKSYFTKIHCPWDVLMKGATILKLKKKLRLHTEKFPLDSGINLCGCTTCLHPNQNVIPVEKDEFFTAIFDEAKSDIFDIEDERTFFTNAERSLIAKLMLDRMEYRIRKEVSHSILERDRHEITEEYEVHVGVNYLLKRNVYTGAYPLHEGQIINCTNDPQLYEGEDKDRLKLYQAWARPKNILKLQPLDLIRKYFGEKVAMYFAWLGVYTTLLIPASLFGLACFLYGVITLPGSKTANDVCDPSGPGGFIMCPACDIWCNYTLLQESCVYARITHVFDNRATIAMAVFMSAWALVFLEIWRREQADLQYDWDVEDYELEENMRPDFQMKIRTTRINPITQKEEPFLNGNQWLYRRGISLSVVLFMVAVVLASIFGILVYRLAVVAALFTVDHFAVRAGAKLIASITSSVINLIICMILSQVYGIIAKKLTNFEAHRTQTSYEDSLTFKLVVFQFINFYGFIFYIAFFKGSFIDRPGANSMYIFGRYREDQCDPSGCIIDLTIQLAVVMIGKQFLNTATQLIIPWITGKWRSRDVLNKQTYMRWEQDYDLNPVSPLMLFNEYLSMVLQFGFVTLFVAAFPLAPLCALVNNLIETRLDAYKMVAIFQRPVATKAQDIGAWFNVLKFLAFLSVITNGFIIAWTSDLVPKMVYSSLYDSTETGFVNNSLSVYNASEFPQYQKPHETVFNGTIDFCRYRDYRYGPDSAFQYQYTPQYWIVFCARLAFVIVFEHVCIFIMFFVMMVIPNVSGRVKRLRVYERELNRKLTFDLKFASALSGHGDTNNIGNSSSSLSTVIRRNLIKEQSIDSDHVIIE